MIYVLFLLGAGLFLLPFVPGLREIRQRRDAGALEVHTDAAVDVRHFAYGFRDWLETHLAEALRRVRETGDREEGETPNGEEYLAIPETEAFLESTDERAGGQTARILAGAGDLQLPEKLTFERELFARGSILGGVDCRYRALLADQDVELAAGSEVTRWVHAGRALVIHPRTTLYGRASADGSIFIHGPCRFERLRAPILELGPREFDEGWREGREELREIQVDDIPHVRDHTGRRVLIDGDFELPAGSWIDADLVVWGQATLHKGSHCAGSVKSHRDLRLEDGVQVDGSLISQQDIRIGVGCRLHGPVLSERRMEVASRCQIGRALTPTTVRADTLVLAMGSVIHGTVWSSHDGEVVA